jgi:hypothetical protein
VNTRALFQAARGELGAGALSRWAQAISEQSVAASNSGALAPAYGQAKAVTPQNGVTSTTILLLSNPGIIRGNLSYVAATGTWVLQAGKTYLLRAAGWFQNFSDATGGVLQVSWVDENNARLQSGSIDCPKTSHTPATFTGSPSNSAALDFIYTAGDTLESRLVKLRTTGGTGTADMVADSWWATVTELPGP